MIKKLCLCLFMGIMLASNTQFILAEELIPFDEINPTDKFTSDGFIGQLLSGGDEPTSGILNLAIVFGGLILLGMIIISGFTMMTNPQNPQAQEAGKQRLTWSIVGFLILFSAYWIMQIIEVIFGLNILDQPNSSKQRPNYVCSGGVCFSNNSKACYCVNSGTSCTLTAGVAGATTTKSCCNNVQVTGNKCPL